MEERSPTVINYPNGDVYEGEVKDGVRDGHGIYTGADGHVYEGEYKDGVRSGYGKESYPSEPSMRANGKTV